MYFRSLRILMMACLVFHQFIWSICPFISIFVCLHRPHIIYKCYAFQYNRVLVYLKCMILILRTPPRTKKKNRKNKNFNQKLFLKIPTQKQKRRKHTTQDVYPILLCAYDYILVLHFNMLKRYLKVRSSRSS